MALSDPQSVTINAVAQSLALLDAGVGNSLYSKSDGLVTMRTQQNVNGKSTRSAIRLDQYKVAADPLLADVNVKTGMSVGLWVIRPTIPFFSVTEMKQLTDALTGWSTASSGANLIKLLGGEH